MTDALRVARDCPRCGDELVVKMNRAHGNYFIACEGYPDCRFTEPFERGWQRVLNRLEALEREIESIRSDANDLRGGFEDRDLRSLLFIAHPDKWPGNKLAHELSVAINRLRAERGRR